jgi:hypothetical protein
MTENLGYDPAHQTALTQFAEAHEYDGEGRWDGPNGFVDDYGSRYQELLEGQAKEEEAKDESREDEWRLAPDAASWSAAYEANEAEIDAFYDEITPTSQDGDCAEL